MATTLPVNFKDDILADSMNGKRRYQLISNSDGTYSLEDVTTYTQEGSNFGAGQLNSICQNVNESVKDMGSFSGSLDSLDAGVYSVNLANCTGVPVSSGSAIVVCVPYKIQTCYVYSGNVIKQVFQRFGQTLSGISGYGEWTVAEMGGVELWSGSGARGTSTLTLSKDVSAFSYYEIFFKVEISGSNDYKTTGKIPIAYGALLDGTNAKALIMRRNVEAPSGTSMKIGDGKYFASFNSDGSVYTNACCPFRIVGYY